MEWAHENGVVHAPGRRGHYTLRRRRVGEARVWVAWIHRGLRSSLPLHIQHQDLEDAQRACEDYDRGKR